jgi:DNA-binding response OmpR family regulator
MRLLIAEDDRALGTFLAHGLQREGHEITIATDGEMALEAAKNDSFEMAVLDLNLPKDGIEVLEFLRTLTEDLPILILSARQEPETRLRCLEMGADDFMQKPFSFVELRARCRALLRRRSTGLVLRQGDLELRRVERSVTRRGEPLHEVWNSSAGAGTNVVDVYINYLRRKLHDPPAGNGEIQSSTEGAQRLIRTVRGVG